MVSPSEQGAFAFARSFWILVGLGVVGTVLTWLLVRSPAVPSEPEADVAQHHARHRLFHH